MPRSRFTDRWLRAHRATEREEWSDSLAPGLLVRFGAGRPVFYARFRVEGKYLRRRIGAFPLISLEEARKNVLELERARERGEWSSAPETFAGLCQLYLEQHARPKKRTAATDERMIERDLVPTFGHRLAGSIRPREVAALLDAVVARGAPVQANRVRALLSRIFAFALARELVETNPAAVTERPTRERSRELYLSDEQLRALWGALEYRHPTLRNMLRFLILTAQRLSEAREARWSEVRDGLWEVPGVRSKNGRANVVPLSAEALAVLADQRALGIDDELIFPAARHPGKPWDLSSVSHAARALRPVVGCDWRPHDLRRTAATIMARLGHRPAVSRVLNHTEQGVTAIYDRHAYLEEKRAALAALGAHVHALLRSGAQSRLPAT